MCVSGGGWLGSVWPQDELFVRRVVKTFMDNPIVILPQTVYYDQENSFMESGAEVYSSHPRLLFCARERTSYDFLISHGFSANNRTLLMPDFALDYHRDLHRTVPKDDKILLCFRSDREAVCGEGMCSR